MASPLTLDDCGLTDEDVAIFVNHFNEHEIVNECKVNFEDAQVHSADSEDIDCPLEDHSKSSQPIKMTNSTTKISLVSLFYQSIGKKTLLQQAKEPRVHYLLRSPKLFQEFMNSGRLNMLKELMEDVFAKDFTFQLLTKSSIVGLDKVFELQCSNLDNFPDYYVLIAGVKRVKRRQWRVKLRSFGTLLPANGNDNLSHIWNIFEHTPVGSLDEHHKLQKQKYDYLKSQNKMIKLERRSFYCLVLNRKMTKFQKVMASASILDVFE